MHFNTPLIKGKLLKRYKRFLADVELADGSITTAHCPNSGSMMGLIDPGNAVWLSEATNPDRKLKYTWEIVEANNILIGINTHRTNDLVAEALTQNKLPELTGYTFQREVKYGHNSRIDFLLKAPNKPDCYLEVKNVTSKRYAWAEFPDAKTERGAKHMYELIDMKKQGHRSCVLFVAQRADCSEFQVAKDIDPLYAQSLAEAVAAGVEVLCYASHVTPTIIEITKPLTFKNR